MARRPPLEDEDQERDDPPPRLTLSAQAKKIIHPSAGAEVGTHLQVPIPADLSRRVATPKLLLRGVIIAPIAADETANDPSGGQYTK
ncbi:MAG: hypothetical protein ACRDSL_23520 [Pseudonocardiaceae bacterium]